MYDQVCCFWSIQSNFKGFQTTNTNTGIQMCDKTNMPENSENIIYRNDLK